MAMLIDEYLPAFDVSERHAIRVRGAPAEGVYAALRSADLAEVLPVRVLLVLRVLPAALFGSRDSRQRLRSALRGPLTLATLEAEGFATLAEAPPRELLLGVEGAFWTPGGAIRVTNATAFRAPLPPGTARAAWNFVVEEGADGSCALSTETRVRCADAASRRRFRIYWLLARPGSGLIRRLMLRSIRRAAAR